MYMQKKSWHKIFIFEHNFCHLRKCQVKTETIPGFTLKSKVKHMMLKCPKLIRGSAGGPGPRGNLQVFEEKKFFGLYFSLLYSILVVTVLLNPHHLNSTTETLYVLMTGR